MPAAQNTTAKTITSADGSRTYTITVSDRRVCGVPRGWFSAKIAGVGSSSHAGPDADAVMKRAVAAVLTGYYDDEIDYLAARS